MNPTENILNYQKRHRRLSHLCFWLAILLLTVSSSKYYDGKEFSYGSALLRDGLFLIPQVIAAYFLTYFVVPRLFFKKKYGLTVVYFLSGSYLICLLARFLMVRMAEPLAGIPPKAFETNLEIMTNLPKLIFVYFFKLFSLAFLFLFLKLVKEQLDIQKRTLTLEKEKAETELRLLKTQLNPHFLFNTLNNIYALSLLNSPATSSSIGKLSEILDYILYRCDKTEVPVSGEVVLLNNYLALEKLRYDDRLKVSFNSLIDRDIFVPPMVLLSIAENAFKHGAANETGRPVIDIGLCVQRGRLEYSVSNSYVPKPVGPSRDAIGLPNLKRQLDLLYPNSHQLTIAQTPELFTVVLVIDPKNIKMVDHENTMPARG